MLVLVRCKVVKMLSISLRLEPVRVNHLGEVRVRGEKNILRLEITVDDVLAVEVLQGHQDLSDEELGDPLREPALLTGQDHLQHVSCKIIASLSVYPGYLTL